MEELLKWFQLVPYAALVWVLWQIKTGELVPRVNYTIIMDLKDKNIADLEGDVQYWRTQATMTQGTARQLAQTSTAVAEVATVAVQKVAGP